LSWRLSGVKIVAYISQTFFRFIGYLDQTFKHFRFLVARRFIVVEISRKHESLTVKGVGTPFTTDGFLLVIVRMPIGALVLQNFNLIKAREVCEAGGKFYGGLSIPRCE
jgi:hypothetical protein